MRLSRRRFLRAGAVFGALTALGCARHRLPVHVPPAAYADLPPLGAEVRLLVLGDWGSGQIEQWQVARAMDRAARESGGFHAGLMLGDNFYPAGVDSVDDPAWREYFEQVYDTEHLGRLHWYPVLGNHDYAGNAQAQIDYSRKNPRWHLPDAFWARTWNNAAGAPLVKIIGLDTNKEFTRWPEQMRFLDRELADAGSTPVVVIGHHPVYTCGKLGALPRVKTELRDKLVAARVAAYLAGHEHNHQLIVRDGLTQLIQGGGGKTLTPLIWRHQAKGVIFADESYGFSVLRAGPGGLRFDWRDKDGRLLHAHKL